ncbi:hypothetical protein TNCV_1279791 [Trichonephila clavipes]|nr:hypothetical protein TNCV_1279791 [Trichonephila clavipes]
MSSVNPAGPTLKQLSLVAIAVKISNDPEIKAYDGFPFKIIRYRANAVPESGNCPTSTMWEEIVSKKISCLGLLPETLKSELRSPYTFHSVGTRRCTRVTDLNAANQNTHCTSCCDVDIITNEISVTSLSSTVVE